MTKELNLEQVAFRQTDPRDIPDLVRFAAEVFDTAWTPEYVQWKYFNNPAGNLYGQVAEQVAGQVSGAASDNHTPRPLGFYGNIPVRIKLGRDIATAAQAVDAMIAADARRLGLFVKLNLETYTQMDAEGIVLDYAFPNPVSAAGFVKRLDWQPVGQVPRYMKVLDSTQLPASICPAGYKGTLAKGLVKFLNWYSGNHRSEKKSGKTDPAVKVQVGEELDPQCTALWQEISPAFSVSVQRDETYLRWRYRLNPFSKYIFFHAWRKKTLTGLAVLSFKDLAGQGSASLVEWLYPGSDPITGAALLQAVEAEARRRGAALIQTWMLPHLTDYTRTLQSQGYLHLSARFTPGFLRYTTPLIIRQRPGGQLSPDPGKIENWYLSMGDHDYY